MRNKLVAAAITSLAVAPAMAQAESEVSWFGFSQITAEQQGESAMGGDTYGGGLGFSGDRIRIGYKAKHGANQNAFSKLQVDFLQTGVADNGVPSVIKDAVVGYDFGPAKVMAGQFKTPVGMDFNTSGKKLDITKRGMEKALVMERATGTMVAGGSGPIGYKVGIFDATSRGIAHADANEVSGENMAYAGQVSYSMGDMLYAEASYGTTPIHTDQVDGSDADDATVMDVGLKSSPMPALTLKAEYISATAVNNVEDNDRSVWYAHGGYEFTPMIEGVVRHYSGSNDATDTDYSETFVGANIFLNPEKHHEARIQLNYVLPGGDTEESGNLGATRAVTDDSGDAQGTFLAQFQTAF